jgi:hypothetical protein
MSYNPLDLTVAILKTELFVGDTVNQSSAQLAELFTALGHLESESKNRKDVIKKLLMERAEKTGKPVGEKGAVEVQASGFKITREKKTSSSPDPDKLKGLLSEHNLPAKAAFDELTVLEVNPSKIQYLVDTGKLPKDQVDALRSTSFSLRVTAPKEIKAMLDVLPTVTLK